MDGQYRDHLMGARLIRKRGKSAETALRATYSGAGVSIVEVMKGGSWTEVEYFFRREFLKEPFADPSIESRSALQSTRRILAFKAADMVDMLARSFKPLGILHVDLRHPDAHRFVGCLIDYKTDALWITSLHRIRVE